MVAQTYNIEARKNGWSERDNRSVYKQFNALQTHDPSKDSGNHDPDAPMTLLHKRACDIEDKIQLKDGGGVRPGFSGARVHTFGKRAAAASAATGDEEDSDAGAGASGAGAGAAGKTAQSAGAEADDSDDGFGSSSAVKKKQKHVKPNGGGPLAKQRGHKDTTAAGRLSKVDALMESLHSSVVQESGTEALLKAEARWRAKLAKLQYHAALAKNPGLAKLMGDSDDDSNEES